MTTEYTNEDSLQVTEMEDGTFQIEWDKNDPRYSWMNELTEQQLQTILTEAIEKKVKEYVD
jgi:hypothetical protein